MTIQNQRHDALVQNALGSSLPRLERASGVWLYDETGKDYIDGCSGAVVANLGHGHPEVLETMRRQAEAVTYAHRGAFCTQGQLDLAARLTEATGFAGAWFVNSGSEAVEAALQIALQYHAERGDRRTVFLSHHTSYHGNTLGALSLSDHARRKVIDGIQIETGRLDSPYGGDKSAEELLSNAEKVIRESGGAIAGILFEPISGATLSCRPLIDGYLEGLRGLCDRYGILLIADEVMTGLGRAGKILASEHWSVKPDLVALGKGLGAGYTPIAATLVASSVLDVLAAGSGRILGGHTYGGNPLSVAVADKVLQITLDEDLIEASERQGALLRSRLEELRNAFPALIETVHGLGLMQGVTLTNASTPSPVGARAERLRVACLREGLVIYPATGGFNDSFIVAPPLTSTTAEIEELIHRLRRAMATLD